MNPTDILLTDQVAIVTGGGGGIGAVSRSRLLPRAQMS